VATVDAVATYDEGRNATTVFVVNRGDTESVDLEIALRGERRSVAVTATTLSDSDVYAQNTLADPERVIPKVNSSAKVAGSGAIVALPPVSWTVIDIQH
jgi:alpha-N-arabinofuranosidase